MTSSILLKNTKNTAGLEWFGPPERNTLHPLCVVLPCPERVCESLCVLSVLGFFFQVQRALPFYISREARTWPLGSRQVGPTMWYKITYYSYIMASQANEISLPDFLTCSWNPPFSVSSRCLVGTAPGVASGVACHVAERPCSLRRRRHDGKVPCRRIQLMRQTGSARVQLHCVSW